MRMQPRTGHTHCPRRLAICALPILLLAALPAQAQLRGHGGPVRAIAVSSDGTRAVSGSFDTRAILWSLSSGSAEKVLRFHEGAVNAVVFLRDGRVATSGEDARIAVWRPGDEKPMTVLAGHTAPVVGLAVSPDGRMLASAAWDHTARLWPLAGGAPRVLEGHQQAVNGRRLHAGRAVARNGGIRCHAAPLAPRRGLPGGRDPADAAQRGGGRPRRRHRHGRCQRQGVLPVGRRGHQGRGRSGAGPHHCARRLGGRQARRRLQHHAAPSPSSSAARARWSAPSSAPACRRGPSPSCPTTPPCSRAAPTAWCAAGTR